MYLGGCKPESSLFRVDYIFLIYISPFLLCFVPSEDLLYLIFLDMIMSLRILKVLKMFLGHEQYVLSFLFLFFLETRSIVSIYPTYSCGKFLLKGNTSIQSYIASEQDRIKTYTQVFCLLNLYS